MTWIIETALACGAGSLYLCIQYTPSRTSKPTLSRFCHHQARGCGTKISSTSSDGILFPSRMTVQIYITYIQALSLSHNREAPPRGPLVVVKMLVRPILGPRWKERSLEVFYILQWGYGTDDTRFVHGLSRDFAFILTRREIDEAIMVIRGRITNWCLP